MFSTIDAKSPWTAGHSERVTYLAVAIGQELRLDSTQLDRLLRGGMVHDIGKLAVPTEILDKRGRLTVAERRIVERHPSAGVDLLAPLAEFADVLPIVRSHHERPDGRGYPDRLCGNEIPWLARVLAVADVYDALTSDRPYRMGMDRETALGLMIAGSGSWLDAAVLEAFLALDLRVRESDLRADLDAWSFASGNPRRSARPAA